MSNQTKPAPPKIVKHQLEYSIYSGKVSWCPKCKCHFYNDRNEIHTTKPTDQHYHTLTR